MIAMQGECKAPVEGKVAVPLSQLVYAKELQLLQVGVHEAPVVLKAPGEVTQLSQALSRSI